MKFIQIYQQSWYISDRILIQAPVSSSTFICPLSYLSSPLSFIYVFFPYILFPFSLFPSSSLLSFRFLFHLSYPFPYLPLPSVSFLSSLSSARDGNLRAVERLIYHGSAINTIDPDFRMTPLFHALREGHMDCARVLLAMGADPTLGRRSGISKELLQLLSEPLTEEFILEVRTRIYFFSLYERLIFSI